MAAGSLAQLFENLRLHGFGLVVHRSASRIQGMEINSGCLPDFCNGFRDGDDAMVLGGRAHLRDM